MQKTINQIENLNMGDSYGKRRALYRAKILYAAYKKDITEIDRLKEEISDKNVRINMDILQKKIERVVNM